MDLYRTREKFRIAGHKARVTDRRGRAVQAGADGAEVEQGVVEGEEGVFGGIVDQVRHTYHLAEVVHGSAAGGGAAERAEVEAEAVGPAERAPGAAGGVEVAGHLAC